jgi:general L-amino acid transport system permease protein
MAIVKAEKTPAREAPLSETTIIGWMSKNLFGSVFNSILTVVTLYIIYLTVRDVWVWGVADAVWVADNRRECFKISIDGACWAGVITWMDNIFYGRYPREELWRINLGAILLFIWMAPLWLPRVKAKVLIGVTTVFLYPFLAGYLFAGGDKGIFMQVMISAAIVCLIGNTLHSIIGVLTGSSLPEFLIRLLGKRDAPEKSQHKILLGILVASLVVIYLWQMGWAVDQMGRFVSYPGDIGDRYCLCTAGRDYSCPWAAFQAACNPGAEHRIHRIVPLGTLDYRVVYGDDDVSIVHARRFCAQ